MYDRNEVQRLLGLLRHAEELVEASSRSTDLNRLQQCSDDLDVLVDAITAVASDIPGDGAWRLCTRLWVQAMARCARCPSHAPAQDTSGAHTPHTASKMQALAR